MSFLRDLLFTAVGAAIGFLLVNTALWLFDTTWTISFGNWW
jgi:hypothetical protein